MRLVFALFTWFDYSGLARDLAAVVRTCRRRGHRVVVYAGESRGVAKLDGATDLRLLPLKSRTNHAKNREFAARLKIAAAEFSPHMIIGFNKMPGLDVYYAADGCFADKVRARRWWYRITPRCRHFLAFEKSVFSPASQTRILMISKPQHDIYRDIYQTPQTRINMLPPGISRDCIAGADAVSRRDEFRNHWKVNVDDKIVLAVGSGFRTKGLDRTIQSIAALPPALRDRTHLFVVGGDKSAPFETLARRLGVRARIRFFGGRDDVPAFLLGADVLAHPAYRENTGGVLLESMVAGLPVIATDVCGYAHYVADAKMGEVLASPFDQTAFNRGMQQLLESPRADW